MSKLIGTGPNQVPTNGDLGSLAYQDAERPRLNNVVISGQPDDTTNGVMLRVKRGPSSSGTWATVAIEAQSATGNSRIAFVNDVDPSAGDAHGMIDFEHQTNQMRFMVNGVQTASFNDAENTFNDASLNQDFRVESDSDTNCLFVDGGSNRVGIKNGGPISPLHINAGVSAAMHIDTQYAGGSGGNTAYSNPGTVNNLLNLRTGYAENAETNPNDGMLWGIRFTGYNGSAGSLTGKTAAVYARSEDTGAGYNRKVGLEFQTSAFDASAATATRITAIKELIHYGSGIFNENGANYDFRVESDYDSHALHVDADVSNVAVGGNGTTRFTVGTTAYNSYPTDRVYMIAGSGGDVTLKLGGYGGTHVFQQFLYAGNNDVGRIHGTSSGITFQTTSDRRLKENIEDLTDGTEKLMAMRPVTHTWVKDKDHPAVHGFIAQEMQEIVPEAVSGTPDGEEMMAMDYGRITPVLVAALQDAHNKIEALEARLTDLEGK